MNKRRLFILLALVLVGGWVLYYFLTREPRQLTLTGIVTTDEVTVSSQIEGRLQDLDVQQGDVVPAGQLLAVIQPEEQLADAAYYDRTAEQMAMQVKQAESDLENARLTYERDEPLYKQQAISEQEYTSARTSYEGAQARVEALSKQTEAARAQHEKAMVELGYTKIVAPIAGIVDTRVALQGEVVTPGQPIVTLINPDDLWVRADVEETYIDRIRLGEVLDVTLPSGDVLPGKVFYRGVDADYATQRDVSQTKRDIKTFEIRLRCDNSDRRLAVGMTAYVTLPLAN